MRSIGLDVRRGLCAVAIVEAGEVSSTGRIETTPESLELFAHSLAPSDRVALEVTGGAWEIARIIEPHVERVVVVSRTTRASARRAQDRPSRRACARKLLAAGSLDSLWVPDEQTRTMRRRILDEGGSPDLRGGLSAIRVTVAGNFWQGRSPCLIYPPCPRAGAHSS